MRTTALRTLALGAALLAVPATASNQVAAPDSDAEVTVQYADPGRPVSVEGEVSKPEGDFEDVIRYRVEGVAGAVRANLRVSIKCTGVATNTTKIFGGGRNKTGCNASNGQVFEQVMNANSTAAGTIRIQANSGPGSATNPAYVKYTLTFTASPYRPN
jgi:hypothetical protein